VRGGDWKLVDLPPAPLQLFNLRNDIGETTNVAASHAAVVADLRKARAARVKRLAPPAW